MALQGWIQAQGETLPAITAITFLGVGLGTWRCRGSWTCPAARRRTTSRGSWWIMQGNGGSELVAAPQVRVLDQLGQLAATPEAGCHPKALSDSRTLGARCSRLAAGALRERRCERHQHRPPGARGGPGAPHGPLRKGSRLRAKEQTEQREQLRRAPRSLRRGVAAAHSAGRVFRWPADWAAGLSQRERGRRRRRRRSSSHGDQVLPDLSSRPPI